MIRRPPRSTQSRSSAASDVYKRQTGLALAPAQQAAASPLTEKQKLDRIASNTWPLRYIFKSRMSFGANPRTAELKKKYGEITMLDMPQFTKDTFPGVTRMD